MHVSKAVCGGQRHQVPLELVIGSKPSMDAVFPVDAGYRTQALCTSSKQYTRSTTELSLQSLALVLKGC